MENSPQQVAGVSEGQVLAGKYRVEHFIAVGGMGAVVAAHHLQLDTRVAIKFLLPSMLANDEAVARFSQEARAAVKITNEHVARVFDVGTLESGAPYMVMEFLHGSDLGTWLQQYGPLEVDLAVGFVLQACEAISEAHTLGIVHRDLKPSNLFCIERSDGRQIIKVLDFGISKITTVAAVQPNITLTLASGTMGSPLYMSPEQMEASHTVDPRADIWALGIILYELLTGRMPFSGDTLPEISVKIASRPPPPLRDTHISVPEGLQAVIFRCLEKDREKRFANVAELALALLPFAPESGVASVRRIIAAAQPAAPSSRERKRAGATSQTIPPVGGASPPLPASGKRSRLRIIAAVGASLLAAALLVTLAPRRNLPSLEEASRVTAISPPTVTNPVTLPPAQGLVQDSVVPVPSAPKVQEARGDRRTGGTMPRAKALSGAPKLTTATAAVAVNPPAPAEAKAECEPNFFLDDWGRKHFKPECWSSATASVGSAGAKADCDPAFYLDDQGRKHFKPECFLNQDR